MKSHAVRLSGSNVDVSNKMLFDTIDLLDGHRIPYHLEGGTLLGIVRDEKLLPWDHDLDISIPDSAAEKLISVIKKRKFYYRYSVRRDCNGVTIVKIKRRWIHYLAQVLPFMFRSKNITLDIFVKYKIGEFVYWSAANNRMRVSADYYTSYELVSYMGRNIKIPNNYRQYLGEKYGDWQTPVKDWHCSLEKTIVGNL